MHDLPQVSPDRRRLRTVLLACLCGVMSVGMSCSEGDTVIQATPMPGPSADDPLPGVVVAVTSVAGGSLPGGNARPGDLLEITFTLHDDAGEPLDLQCMSRSAVYVSGPTFNYQRVIDRTQDVVERAEPLGHGRYRYRFAQPVPDVYLEPYNNAPEVEAGELGGQPLLAGTYTVGLELRKDHEIEGVIYRDVGNASADFLFGSAQELQPREVVTMANCVTCHGELRSHGGNRTRVENCLLCHTAGSRDRDGVDGPSVDFKVMIHKIHAGASLPSVNGVGTAPDGSRDYGRTPEPYAVRGFGTADFSHVRFPSWPSMTRGMPRDVGYQALDAGAQAQEDAVLLGPVACASCHGDPDGEGPLPAPRDGELVLQQPSRAACASCHDDWDPELPYTANQQTMPPQLDDATCRNCHPARGTSLAVEDAHRHPLTDDSLVQGLQVEVVGVSDQLGNADSNFDVGEAIGIEMTFKDADGAPVDPATLDRVEVVLGGPVPNPNLIHFVRLPVDEFGDGPVHMIRLPETLTLEVAGVSDGSLQSFTTVRSRHRDGSSTPTRVYVDTATGPTTVLQSPVVATENYLDVVDANGIGAGDVVRLDAAGQVEYLRIRHVDSQRLWLSSQASPTYGSGAAARPIRAGAQFAHPAGATVEVAVLLEVDRANYLLDAPSGVIQETSEFGPGPVLVTYTADFLVPPVYPGALNQSPDVGQERGNWAGLPLLDGTYRLSAWASRSFVVDVLGETTSYVEASPAAEVDLQFGDVPVAMPSARIDDLAACDRCHGDLQFHGGRRRGVASCMSCHGLAGSEDAPVYVYPAADPTPGVTVDFAAMLHKIHHGRDLAAGADYVVVGFGGNPHTYEHATMPNMPGASQDCSFCHGEGNEAHRQPDLRLHPQAIWPTRSWGQACGSCHDSAAAQAHIDTNTSSAGAESCAVCHGPGEEHDVERTHRVR